MSRAAVGYLMVAVAATLFAVNAPVVKVIEHTGFSSERLTEVRSTGAMLGLWAVVLVTRRQTARVTRRELVLLAAIGVLGLALVQWSYFFAIHRLPIGEALLIQYLAPILVALWARFAFRERVRRRVWAALGLSLAGLVLIVELWRGLRSSGPSSSRGARSRRPGSKVAPPCSATCRRSTPRCGSWCSG
ncbi:MAG: DMT family transporter [Acidobacteria bacterium]|nr:DMT family transporter [Acidobacteriota bacterium]